MNYKNSFSQTNPIWNGAFNSAVLPLTPDPSTRLRAGKDSSRSPKIGLTFYIPVLLFPLRPTLTQTTAPLLASVCSGESPAPHNPQPKPTLNTSLSLSTPPTSLQLYILFFFLFLCGSLFFFSPGRLSLSSCFVQFFCFQCIASLVAFTPLLLTLPWDQFTCAWPNLSSHRTPLYATVMESSPPLSSLLSFTGSSSQALSLTELLLTFCLLTHFKFN